MAKKRTFGQLKQGSYLWEAGIGSVARRSVTYINYNPGGSICTGKVSIGIGCGIGGLAYVDDDATEFSSPTHHWFTDKEDARKCAYRLMLDYEKEQAQRLVNLRNRIAHLKEQWKIKS